MSDEHEGFKRVLEEIVTEEDLINHSEHKKAERKLLFVRNASVVFAMLFFIFSLCSHIPMHKDLRGIGYLFGAAAYFTELLMLTDCFRKKIEHKELFMVYCFFPMYLIFAVFYFFE